MNIAITGGSGLIGSHLAEKLVSLGHEVVILDDESTGKIENLSHLIRHERLKFVKGSVLDKGILSEIMPEVECCYHLAASLGVKRILEKPRESLEINFQGTENVLEAATKWGSRVFMASTSEIYGKNPDQPLVETSSRILGSPLNVRWAYSEAKALDESLLQMFKQEKGLSFVIGRFFNTVGPRQTGSYGMVLPRFVRAALRGEDIQVYGEGSQTRVFCHVKDAVDAVIALMATPEADGEAFNIGGEGEISMNELALKVKDISGSPSKIVHIPYSKAYPAGFEETFRRVPNTTKLRTLTNWKPNYSLTQIIEDVIAFERNI